MLQQTRAAVVVPYFRTFLARFPTVVALARAPLPAVLRAWAGLGYYRRARALHRAAGIVAREHAGRVPDEPAAFGRLPGVGRYTAGAVLSIAYGRPLPAVDGNVARVLSRLCAVPDTARGASVLWRLAEALVPRARPGDWNEALMELGALVCTPRAPRCGDCPLRRHCRALATDRVAELPPARARRRPEQRRQAVALVERRGRMLVARRAGPLLEGLWEPPTVELAPGAAALPALRARLAELGIAATLRPTGRVVRHTITHRELTAEIWHGTLDGPIGTGSAARWVDPRRPGLALTALAGKVARIGPIEAAGRALPG